MRTTIDLPDGLYRKAKVRAAQEGLPMKELIRRCVENGLKEPIGRTNGSMRPIRSAIPIARAATGTKLPILTNEDIASIFDQEDAEAADGRHY